MRAICLTKYGSVDNLVSMDLPMPEPKRGQIRVRVHASAVGPADFKVATGLVTFLHGRKFPMILGYDFSGVVDAVGDGQTRWKIGDPVFGFLPYGPRNNQGAFSEFLVTPEDQVARKPSSVSHSQAAASATAAVTALQGIRDQGKLPTVNADVLITGVSGAVGSTAILVAKRLGAKVTAVGSQRGLELAKRLGADVTIDRKGGDIVEKTNSSYDVVFDAAAAYRWSLWKKRLKAGGAFVTTLPSVAFATDKLASSFSSSSAQFFIVKAREKDLKLVANWLSEGFEVPIDSNLPVREVPKGILRYQGGSFLGRIVVDVENGF
jgi:NADPH:quinone reductase-like Zn-dependent oxidoreductase